MSRFGTENAGAFVGKVAAGIWTEIHDVLIPQMETYKGKTPVRVPFDAAKWEGHIVSEQYNHLRIDYQGQTGDVDTTAIIWENGSNGHTGDAKRIPFGNWQVQFGPENAKRKTFTKSAKDGLKGDDLQKHKGSIAGIHMALENDFTIQEIQRAFQLSYAGSGEGGNTFGVLMPTGPYIKPVVEVQKRWIVNLKCYQACRASNKAPFKVNFGIKGGDRFSSLQGIQSFLLGALANLKCPVCGCIGALRVEGQDSVLELAAADKSGAKFNFDRMDHILTKV